ncbi:hypothetical protein BS47DRAFT_1389491 [Hydnum rufescens UP504]|uniref:Uncharacterized protein n=1 Tax=Hydnum rufescens UP504 TaxID=1448309 RepID=A0A9P6B7M5_9AGAM|nr:hypothetical protein BS47DRAFT_1389491 [Hydnum rufescens UP504]
MRLTGKDAGYQHRLRNVRHPSSIQEEVQVSALVSTPVGPALGEVRLWDIQIQIPLSLLPHMFEGGEPGWRTVAPRFIAPNALESIRTAAVSPNELSKTLPPPPPPPPSLPTTFHLSPLP